LIELNGVSRIPKAAYYKLREIPLSILVIINVFLEKLEAFVFCIADYRTICYRCFWDRPVAIFDRLHYYSSSGGQFQTARWPEL